MLFLLKGGGVFLKVLLIVDIQYSMGHWFSWTYLNKIDRFLHKHRSSYDKVLMIMEPDLRRKAFEGGQAVADGKWFISGDKIPEFIGRSLSIDPIYKAYNKDFWRELVRLGRVRMENFVQVKTDSLEGNYLIYLNAGLKRLLRFLSLTTNIDIIGGGRSKCVKLTSSLLDRFNINHTVLEDYCYDIWYINSNRRDENTFETQPTKATNKRILNTEGKIGLIVPTFNLKQFLM